MKIFDTGHSYGLGTLDGDVFSRIVFVKREGRGFPFNAGNYPGTNLQEVLRVSIDRLKFLSLQAKELGAIESQTDNARIIVNLREAIYILEQRAARRHGRKLALTCEELQSIELQSTCKICGHIGLPHDHKER